MKVFIVTTTLVLALREIMVNRRLAKGKEMFSQIDAKIELLVNSQRSTRDLTEERFNRLENLILGAYGIEPLPEDYDPDGDTLGM